MSSREVRILNPVQICCPLFFKWWNSYIIVAHSHRFSCWTTATFFSTFRSSDASGKFRKTSSRSSDLELSPSKWPVRPLKNVAKILILQTLNTRVKGGASWHKGSVRASHAAALGLNLSITEKVFWCCWGLSMALVRGQWTEAWKFWSNPSCPC